MRIFVTGATGFIGSHFANAASAAGYDVLAVRRPKSIPRVPVSELVRWIEKPLTDISVSDIASCKAIVHFSAKGVSPQPATYRDAYQHNLLDQLCVLEAAADADVRRVVVCGTCMEYGPKAEQFDYIPPTAALEPRGVYASSKAAGCVASLAFARDRLLSLVYLRVFNAYGIGQDQRNLWPSLRAAALSGSDYPMTPGEQVRDFVDVDQVAATFLDVCTNRSVQPGHPEVHNVGSGKPATILEFSQHWWRTWGAAGRLLPGAIPYRPDEVMRYVPKLTL